MSGKSRVPHPVLFVLYLVIFGFLTRFVLVPKAVAQDGNGSIPGEVVGDVRVQVLSGSLVRFEVRGPKGFEDRRTYHVVNRDWAGTELTKTKNEKYVILKTAGFIIKIPRGAEDLNGIVVTDTEGEKITEISGLGEHPFMVDRIENKWTGEYLYDAGDKLGYGTEKDKEEYYWELVSRDGHTLIKNVGTDDYIYISPDGKFVRCGDVDTESPRAQWRIVGSRIQCQSEKFPDYLHVENRRDYVEHAPGETKNEGGDPLKDWHSAQWFIEQASSDEFSNRKWVPHPKEDVEMWALADSPRYVPAKWGYNYPGKDMEKNGWDLNNPAMDVYMFLPRGDVKRLRKEYLKLTGRVPMLPLYALGCWDSRWWPYTEKMALKKIDTYRQKDLPLDVFVVDTNWRKGGSHGYEVAEKYYPDMERFLSKAHDRHVRIMFNDHPEPVGKALNPEEVKFRNNGLRKHFDNGLDIWWYDRNWGVHLDPPEGLNKEQWGMYVFKWITQDYYPNRRPMIVANEDGCNNGSRDYPPSIAAHRSSYHWTGDIRTGYRTLKNEVDNMLYYGIHEPMPYLSSDIGGHRHQPTKEEYCRWLQYGAFSPIYRTHSTKGEDIFRAPWKWPAPVEEIARNFTRMRMRLLPVLYSASRESYDTGRPILRRCDLEYPDFKEAADGDQYLLGDSEGRSEVLVAPMFGGDGARREVWIPPGQWMDVWTGNIIQGPKNTSVTMPLTKMPLYVRCGSIVTLAPDMQYTSEKPWNPLTLDVYPGNDKKAVSSIYEDDGLSNDYKDGGYRRTRVEASLQEGKLTIQISPAEGDFPEGINVRSWRIRVHCPPGWNGMSDASVIVDGEQGDFELIERDTQNMPFANSGGVPDGEVMEVLLPEQPVSAGREIVIKQR